MSKNNNQSCKSSKSTNKLPHSTSSLDLSNKQVSNHIYMDNDLKSNIHHTEYSTTISTVSNNSKTNTTSSISQI